MSRFLFHDNPDFPLEWRVVFCTNIDFEAELVKACLSDAGIDSVIFTKRDRMFSFFAHHQPIELLVRLESFEEASRLIGEFQSQRSPIHAISREQHN